MHWKGEISSFRERKKDSKIYRRISLFLSTMVFLTKKNIRFEAKFTGKVHRITFQQRCKLKAVFLTIKANVIKMVRAESTHLRSNLKSISTKNFPKKHPRRCSNIVKLKENVSLTFCFKWHPLRTFSYELLWSFKSNFQ